MTYKKLSFYDSGNPSPTNNAEMVSMGRDTSVAFHQTDLPLLGWTVTASGYSDWQFISPPPITHGQTGEDVEFQYHVDVRDDYSNQNHHVKYYFQRTKDSNDLSSVSALDYIPWGAQPHTGYTVWKDDQGDGVLVISDTLTPMFWWPSFSEFCGQWNPQPAGENDLYYCDKLMPIYNGYVSGVCIGSPYNSSPVDLYAWAPLRRTRISSGSATFTSADQNVYLYENFYLHAGNWYGAIARFGPGQYIADYPTSDTTPQLQLASRSTSNSSISNSRRIARYLYNGRYYVGLPSNIWLDFGDTEPDLTLTSNGIDGGAA